jgi:hypothetical protein
VKENMSRVKRAVCLEILGDVLISQDLWRYLSLPDWLILRSAGRRFRTLLDCETVFKGIATALSTTEQTYVTGKATWKQRVILDHLASTPSFTGRTLFRGVTSQVWAFSAALKFADGYAFTVWYNVRMPNLCAGLLAMLGLRQHRVAMDAYTHVSGDFIHSSFDDLDVRNDRCRLVYVRTSQRLLLDIQREMYVLGNPGNLREFKLQCTYAVSDGAVELETSVHTNVAQHIGGLLSAPVWIERSEMQEGQRATGV